MERGARGEPRNETIGRPPANDTITPKIRLNRRSPKPFSPLSDEDSTLFHQMRTSRRREGHSRGAAPPSGKDSSIAVKRLAWPKRSPKCREENRRPSPFQKPPAARHAAEKLPRAPEPFSLAPPPSTFRYRARRPAASRRGPSSKPSFFEEDPPMRARRRARGAARRRKIELLAKSSTTNEPRLKG